MPLSKPQAKLLPPDVKAALVEAVKQRKTQVQVAKEMGVSVTVVNTLLKDKYTGDVATMAERIRGLYMAETVNCPVMGQLGKQHCLDYQKRSPANTNPMRAALSRACKTCPNRKEPS